MHKEILRRRHPRSDAEARDAADPEIDLSEHGLRLEGLFSLHLLVLAKGLLPFANPKPDTPEAL